MNYTDIAFLVIAVIWCGLWVFVWARAVRRNWRIPFDLWRHFYKFLAFGVFWWSQSKPFVREHYPWLPWVAFAVAGIFTWPAIKAIYDDLNNDESARPRPVSSE